jgi:hypothetical protein
LLSVRDFTSTYIDCQETLCQCFVQSGNSTIDKVEKR